MLGLIAATALADPIAPSIELGAAGPNDLAVLDEGNFSLSFNPGTATINGQQVVEGEITGNVADAAGNVSLSTGDQVTGALYLGSGASVNTASDAASVQTGSTLPANDLALAFGATGAASYYNSLTADFTAAPSAGTVAAGVYDLSSWNLSGGTYDLTADEVYVFNITGNFTLNQGAQFLDSTPDDVIFNVGGNVSTSGGLNNPGEVEIDGVVMAKGSISLTPGFDTPELISDKSINIASGGGVAGQANVPDRASTFVLLTAALGLLVPFKRLLAA